MMIRTFERLLILCLRLHLVFFLARFSRFDFHE